jgi:hypothetical protein
MAKSGLLARGGAAMMMLVCYHGDVLLLDDVIHISVVCQFSRLCSTGFIHGFPIINQTNSVLLNKYK